MKLILAILSFAFFDCSAQSGVLGVAVPHNADPILIIFTGESNAGGIGLNASATAPEIAPRSEVQILNNNSLLFEDLDIGTNNLLLHANLESYATTAHGWELELANLVASGEFEDHPVYLVKAGQGGTRIDMWCPGCSYTGPLGTMYPLDTLYKRVDSAITLIENIHDATPLIYVFYSQGINDIASSTNEATWKAATKTHIARIRTRYGLTVPFFLTKFNMNSPDWTGFNDSIDAIASEINDCYSIDATSAAYDGYAHWSYAGLKTMCDRIVTSLTTNYPQ